MKLKEILAVTGQSGLFKFVSQGRNGMIVESLLDKKRSCLAVTAKASSLTDVVVFADPEEVPLHKILTTIKEKQKGEQAIDVKKASNDELSGFFAEILPTYDRERVHLSDIKKMIAWYNILQQNALLDFEIEAEDDTETSAGEKASAPSVAHKPVQQASPKASTKAAGTTKIMAPRKAQ
ncbi:hypothetical protein FACS189467_8990 [Bacteroidia bacterium]|nr:hypothetical protein FACS189467_8990 [Bacteroidia bacterium]